jgi:D-3-phosphoglycerate dehydrogenase
VRVSILDDFQSTIRTLECAQRLVGHDVTVWTDHTDDHDVLARRLADTEALVLIRERTPLPAALVERLPALRLVSLRSSYRHVDVDACTRRGVVVCSNLHADTPSYAAAELTWALIMAAARDLPRHVVALRLGTWQGGALGRTLRGRTLGILGYGRIGATVAGYGRAFGMDVQAWSGPASRERAAADGVRVTADQAELFATSDVLSVHLRVVPATVGIVTAADLARMRPDALFVNTSRAALVEPGALEAALEAGRPGGAAVDVFEREPVVDGKHPLLARDDVIATPHLGFVTREEWELQFADVFDQVVAFAAGAPLNVVNPEALAAGQGAAPR